MQLKLVLNLDPPASSAQVLELQIFATMPRLIAQFFLETIQTSKQWSNAIKILVEKYRPSAANLLLLKHVKKNLEGKQRQIKMPICRAE